MSRRCQWCWRRLRFWQVGTCRCCSWALAYSPSPPCPAHSRAEEPADGLLRPWVGSWVQR